MWTVKKRYPSLVNLHHNPQSLPKAKQTIKRQNTITSRQTPVLPKLLKNNTPNPNPFTDTISNFSVKKAQRQQMKQLGTAISTYQLHRQQYLKNPFNQLSFDIMEVIRKFSLVENNFQQLFTNIYQDLKGFIYLTSNIQLAAKYQLKQGQLYKEICQHMDAKTNQKLRQYQIKIKEAINQKELVEQQKKLQQLQFLQKQKKFLQQIQWYKKISNNQYVKYLQQKLQQAKDRIEQLELSQLSLVRLRDQLEKQIQKHQDTISDQLQQIGRLNVLIRDLMVGKEQSQKIILKLRDRFDQFNLKMIGIRNIISDVQKENQELKTQRVVLIKRAAVSFQQLTPRPKYKKVFNFNQKQSKLKLKSTDEVMNIVLEKIGVQAYKKQFRDQLFDLKLSQTEAHPKLVQVQEIRFKTQSQILSSKEQLNSVTKLLSVKNQSIQLDNSPKLK